MNLFTSFVRLDRFQDLWLFIIANISNVIKQSVPTYYYNIIDFASGFDYSVNVCDQWNKYNIKYLS